MREDRCQGRTAGLTSIRDTDVTAAGTRHATIQRATSKSQPASAAPSAPPLKRRDPVEAEGATHPAVALAGDRCPFHRVGKTETDGRSAPPDGDADGALRQAEQQCRCRRSSEGDVQRRGWTDPRGRPVGPRAGGDEQQVPRAEEEPDLLDLQRQPPLQLEHGQEQEC